MVRREHLLLVMAGCLLAAALQVRASDVKILRLPDLHKDPESFLLLNLRVSDLMVEGIVLAVNDSVSAEKGFDPASRTHGELYTFVTLQVDSVLKGDHNAPILTFWQWGGRRWGHRVSATNLTSKFIVGRRVVVFLYSRTLTTPLAEGLVGPSYQFGYILDHYVVLDGSVYQARDLSRSVSDREGGDESHIRAVPLFSLRSMFEVVGGYLRSTSIESLAVNADVIAVGQVISRHVAVDDSAISPVRYEIGEGLTWPEVIVFGDGSIVKGKAAHMPLEIRTAGITSPDAGCAYDKAVFPDNERILIFLQGPTDGVYRPLSYWKAAQALHDETEETAAIERIAAVLGR